MEPSANSMSWLKGFASLAGFRFVRLPPDGKGTTRKWRVYDKQVGAKGLASARRWLEAGAGVGILPVPPVVCLDADCAEEIARIEAEHKRLGVRPARVNTPSGEGAHFWIRLPECFPLERLKNHCRPMDEHGTKFVMDCKFGPQTLVVAPGTIRKGIAYEPVAPWPADLPEIDPRQLYPGFDFWHPAEKPKAHPASAKGTEVILATPAAIPVDVHPFLTCQRSAVDRVRAAERYLASPRTWVSIAGKNGRNTMAKIVAHLVGWYRLRPAEAVSLLTKGEGSWNASCRYQDGTPYPWTKAELLSACKAAVGKGDEYGRDQWTKAQPGIAEMLRMHSHIKVIKGHLTEPVTKRVPVVKVLEVLGWLGCPDLAIRPLCKAIRAHGIQVLPTTKARIPSVVSLNLRAAINAMIRAERDRQSERLGRALNVCPFRPASSSIPSLYMHSPALPPVAMHVGSSDPLGIVQVESELRTGYEGESRTCAESTPGIVVWVGVQTTLPWAEVTALETLSPASSYLPRLGVLANRGLLAAMGTKRYANLRDQVIALFWPGQKAALESLRQMRFKVRHAGLVDDDGALTPAGVLALENFHAA